MKSWYCHVGGRHMCLFCDLSKNSVVENELCYMIYDKFPAAPGHALIIPKRHVETVFEMNDQEWAAAGALIKIAKSEIEMLYSPVGYNIKVNCGKAAGQEIMHAHFHLIPKYQKQKGNKNEEKEN